MPRKPKGTLIRTLADWDVLDTVTAGCIATFVTGGLFQSVQEVALYNDSKQGRLLVVDGWDASCENAQLIAYQQANVNGDFAIKGTPILSQQAPPDGAIYTYNQATALPITNSKGSGALMYNTDAPQTQLTFKARARGPLAVLRPGYSYAVNTWGQGNDVLFVNFYWTVVEAVQ